MQSSGVSAAELSSCMHALSFLFRICTQYALSGEQLVLLLRSDSDFSDTTRTTTAHIYSEYIKVSHYTTI